VGEQISQISAMRRMKKILTITTRRKYCFLGTKEMCWIILQKVVIL